MTGGQFLRLALFGFLCRIYNCQTILSHKNELKFGKFGSWEFCPTGSYANSFEIKVDRNEKNFSDEEGMTGIRLFCADESGEVTDVISSHTLQSGNWKGINTCPPEEWINAFRIKIQKYSGWVKDDTGANDLEMVCNSTNIYNGRGNDRGDWTDWSKCPQGQVICGIRTKIEDSFTADRAGLIAVNMLCCKLFGDNETITTLSYEDYDYTEDTTTVPTSTDVPLMAERANDLTNLDTQATEVNTTITETTEAAPTTGADTLSQGTPTPSDKLQEPWETFPSDDEPVTPSFSSRLIRAHI